MKSDLAKSLLFTLAVTSLCWAQTETKTDFDQRTAWWREARFGMFIHWGLYAIPADATNLKGEYAVAEWHLTNKQVQVAEYEKFAPQFNPVKFDAAAWVAAAKNAGMKYIVITSKHHDGFCMFNSALTDYDIVDATPFKRDPIKELAAECQKQGLRLCFYHSIMDWHHPDYLPRRPWEQQTRPADGADFERYVQYMKGQIRELLTNYGPIGVMWFDGEWENMWDHEHGVDLYNYVRGLQPDILVNNRVDKLRAGMQGMSSSAQAVGDFGTPEQQVPAAGFPDGRLWESCMTMNGTWGYARNDTNWKSSETLIRTLCDIAHKGGNFLLNVGPTAEGEFPEAITQRLAEMGQWMHRNGEAIYGTTASPFRRMSFDGRCTRKGNTLYLLVFNWPEGDLMLGGLTTPIEAVTALADGERLVVKTATPRTPDGTPTLAISRPKLIDPVATVIVLQLAGEPKVVESATQPDERGAFLLRAADADVHGTTARYELGNGKDNIGYWTDARDYVSWQVLAPAPAEYRVEITYACPAEDAGATFSIDCPGGPAATGVITATGDWTNFRAEPATGTLKLPAGKQEITVRITNMPGQAAMNLWSVRLTPVPAK